MQLDELESHSASFLRVNNGFLFLEGTPVRPLAYMLVQVYELLLSFKVIFALYFIFLSLTLFHSC